MRNEKGSLIRPVPLPGSASRPVVTPLSPSVVYASDTPDMLDRQYEGELHGYTYSREGHPNADVVAGLLDRMENAPNPGVVTSSGMAAVSAVLLGLLKSGDHVIGGNQLYGRSLRMMAEDLPRLGIETTLADPGDVDAVRAALRPETRMILVEVVSMLGYVAARDAAINTRLRVFTVTAGMTPSPFDCWLAERGMLSFDLRFERCQSTAMKLADALGTFSGVKRVIYPARQDHPDHARATDLLQGRWCNMVSFELDGGREAANAFTTAAEGLSFAPTLGDVGTTLSHPASSSHRALTAERRASLGMSEGFFRVSVGLEDPDALVAIFERAVAAAVQV